MTGPRKSKRPCDEGRRGYTVGDYQAFKGDQDSQDERMDRIWDQDSRDERMTRMRAGMRYGLWGKGDDGDEEKG